MAKSKQRIAKLVLTDEMTFLPNAELRIRNQDGTYTLVDLAAIAPLLTQEQSRMGFWDYNDAATAVTPIVLTPNDTFVKITNDELGPGTEKTYAIPGFDDVWDPSTNQFDWSGFALGDVFDVRFDFQVETMSNNTEISFQLDVAVGHAGNYQLNMHRETFKSMGTYNVVFMFSIYMGNARTLNFPTEVMVKSDTGTTDEVVVNGWFVEAHTRSNY